MVLCIRFCMKLHQVKVFDDHHSTVMWNSSKVCLLGFGEKFRLDLMWSISVSTLWHSLPPRISKVNFHGACWFCLLIYYKKTIFKHKIKNVYFLQVNKGMKVSLERNIRSDAGQEVTDLIFCQQLEFRLGVAQHEMAFSAMAQRGKYFTDRGREGVKALYEWTNLTVCKCGWRNSYQKEENNVLRRLMYEHLKWTYWLCTLGSFVEFARADELTAPKICWICTWTWAHNSANHKLCNSGHIQEGVAAICTWRLQIAYTWWSKRPSEGLQHLLFEWAAGIVSQLLLQLGNCVSWVNE